MEIGENIDVLILSTDSNRVRPSDIKV